MRKIFIKNMEQLRESVSHDGYGIFIVNTGVSPVTCLEVDYIPKTDMFLVNDVLDDGAIERMSAHQFEEAYKVAMNTGNFYKEID